jgi:hypothetical protein
MNTKIANETDGWRAKAREATVEALDSLAEAVQQHRETSKVRAKPRGDTGGAGGALLATIAVMYPVAAAAAIAIVGFIASGNLATL